MNLAVGHSDVMIGGVTGGFPASALRRAVLHTLEREGRGASVSLTFLGREQMRRLNASALGHDQPTDVISFQLPQPQGRVAGDIYICRHEAVRSARLHRCSLRDELCRLSIHGVLHVLGYDHPAGVRRTDSDMWRRQERYLGELSC